MKSIVLILWAIEKDDSFSVEGNLSISENLSFTFNFLDFLLLMLVDEAGKVYFPDVAKQKIVESSDIGVGTPSYYVDRSLILKQHLQRREKFLLWFSRLSESFDLHQLLELLLYLEVLNRILFKTSLLSHLKIIA